MIESVEVAETVPLIACSGPVSEPIANVVVVALIKSAFVKCEVLEAKTPCCAQKGEEVAAAMTP